MSEICTLDDGRRIKFSLKCRNRDPYFLVQFRGPDRKLKERSTKEQKKNRAIDSAHRIIREEYDPNLALDDPDWKEAEETLVELLEAKKLREATIIDYVSTLHTLRDMFPRIHGPGHISSRMAERYKKNRLDTGYSPWTVKGNLNTLSIIYRKWFVKAGKVVNDNPFEDIEPPKTDKLSPRIILPEEAQAYFDWLLRRWDDWRFPILFLEVKGLIGCRITELASARTDGLKDGRIRFNADTTKGRKQRSVKLPTHIFEELQKLAGREYLFEKFAEQLRQVHINQGNSHHSASVGTFKPEQLVKWMQKEKKRYFDDNPDAKPFKLHNFRGTAMSKARMAGVSFDDAAVAFGCHPETMRQHYTSLDEETITDKVMDAMNGEESREKNGEIDGDSSSNGDGGEK